jgi:hypothetical protein
LSHTLAGLVELCANIFGSFAVLIGDEDLDPTED